jgi:two-component system CheB/CheR fusion protein
LLGHSETTAPAAELFTPYGKSEKIYTRKNVPGKFLHLSSDKKGGLSKDNVLVVKKEPGRMIFNGVRMRWS